MRAQSVSPPHAPALPRSNAGKETFLKEDPIARASKRKWNFSGLQITQHDLETQNKCDQLDKGTQRQRESEEQSGQESFLMPEVEENPNDQKCQGEETGGSGPEAAALPRQVVAEKCWWFSDRSIP